MEQIETDASIGSDECKTGDCNEKLQEIYQQIRAAYNNSEVPEDERPLIPNNEFNYPSNVNEVRIQHSTNTRFLSVVWSVIGKLAMPFRTLRLRLHWEDLLISATVYRQQLTSINEKIYKSLKKSPFW
ncbi:hypothetical protein DPMN_053404 [Dreissena polymorpha]|uniref:Uncharacterized protein n=1 Tax=Dreissena polymorpha TaxID=45954 RepID=A0A9D4HNT3_DREPO|nr:hypothetical protein DPMN_053404 [Dreissena polymorpha]